MPGGLQKTAPAASCQASKRGSVTRLSESLRAWRCGRLIMVCSKGWCLVAAAPTRRSIHARNQVESGALLVSERVLWKTRRLSIFNQKPLARRIGGAYIASSRRPQLVVCGPRDGPEAATVALFWKLFGLLRGAEKSSRKAVDGKEDWVLYPALSQTGPATEWPERMQRTTRPKGHCPRDV